MRYEVLLTYPSLLVPSATIVAHVGYFRARWNAQRVARRISRQLRYSSVYVIDTKKGRTSE